MTGTRKRVNKSFDSAFAFIATLDAFVVGAVRPAEGADSLPPPRKDRR